MSLRRGVAYIEFARPLPASVTKGLNTLMSGVTDNAPNKVL